jgi:hypothetical protein
MSKVTPPYGEFVTKLGKEIVDTMTGRLHKQLLLPEDIKKTKASQLNAEIEEMCKNAEEKKEKWKLLKILFLEKVGTFEETKHKLGKINLNMFDLQHVATELYKNREGDDVDAEQQLKFFLDLFVLNLRYIEHSFPVSLYVSHKWQMQMAMKP